MPSEEGLITLEEIQEARKNVQNSSFGVIKTPLLEHVAGMFPQISSSVDLYLKLENTQTTGSFKIRGVANQLHFLPKDVIKGERKLITMSAGNYGKAFAYALHGMNLSGLCLMPITAPENRVATIKEYGVAVEQVPTPQLENAVNKHVQDENYLYLHSFDDFDLIAGYGSVALEILEEGIKPDVVLVCCGGGGLVSGVAAALKLSGLTECKVYAVEPKGSPTMHESIKVGEPVTMQVQSVAGGLSPPYAGTKTFKHCKKFIDGVILVSDEELVNCMNQFYQRGFVVEPSGCAAMAALIGGHVPDDLTGKKVVVLVTGGNITPLEIIGLAS